MSLPLPEKKTILVAIEGSPAYFSGYSTEQMREYGQACRAAALEEATEAAIDACGFNGASVQLEAHIREAIKRLK